MSKTVFGLVKGNNILLNFLFTAFKNSMKTFLLAPKTFLKKSQKANVLQLLGVTVVFTRWRFLMRTQ